MHPLPRLGYCTDISPSKASRGRSARAVGGKCLLISAATIVAYFVQGIAPTIIAVRVALGQSVENVNSFIVPRPRARSPSHQEARAAALNGEGDEVLYIQPESVKVEAV